MSTRHNNGSQYQNHQRAAELHDGAAHAHRVAEQKRGQQDHLTAHEYSRQALEHSQTAHEHTHETAMAQGIPEFGQEAIALLAHKLWQERGCPEGSSQEDWFRASRALRSRTPSF